ncbi:MAG: MOSC domain-containing protein [Alphaproteobacteria bacterium]|nr:MOSC domain-containing protein [Alphaproteobacteria bacterium]
MTRLPDLHLPLPRSGRVEWLGLSAERRSVIQVVDAAFARAGEGLDGDHHGKRRGGLSRRQVTLLQAEHLPVIASLLGQRSVSPTQLRRNVVVSGFPVLALIGRRFRVGGAVLEGTMACTPCARMDETLGPGGFLAVVGHGGICARVVGDGSIAVGDTVGDLEALSPTPGAVFAAILQGMSGG